MSEDEIAYQLQVPIVAVNIQNYFLNRAYSMYYIINGQATEEAIDEHSMVGSIDSVAAGFKLYHD